MSKEKLQQEILTKVKPGIKPSDIKKMRSNQSKKPDGEDNIVVPTELRSDQLLTPPPTPPLKPVSEDTLPPIDIEITENKPGAKQPPSKATKITTNKPITKEPKQYLFTCDICEQNKKSQLHIHRVNGLAIDPNKLQKICDYCIRKVDIIPERKEEFF